MLDQEGFKELPLSEFLRVAGATWLVLNGSFHRETSCWGHEDCPLGHCTAGRAPRACADAVHLPDGLHPCAERDLSVVIRTLAQKFDIY